MHEKEPANLEIEEIEEIEALTLRWIFQAILDFGMESYEIFFYSPDHVTDIKGNGTNENYEISSRKQH